MKFMKQTEKNSNLTLQDVELQGSTCLTGESVNPDYTYTNSPCGGSCSTPGGFDVTYINT